MGNRTHVTCMAQPSQLIKPELSKTSRIMEISIKPAKAIFNKLPQKPHNIDDEVIMETIQQATTDKNTKRKTENNIEIDDEDYQLSEESLAEEIKIKWNSFIKMKKSNYLEEYAVLQEIGRGGFGTVNKVKAKFTGVMRAAKKIKKSNMCKQEHQKLFQQMATMINLDHPNIARLFQVYDYKNHYVLILELCEGGQLFKRIISRNVNEASALGIISQLIHALVYLHGRGIVHRDIKPENILFQKGSNYLKLIDFGISVTKKDNQPLTARIGTPYYIAPEVLCKHYGQKCDLWSVGVMLYMMLTYKPPFNGDNQMEVMEKILKKQPSYLGPSFNNVSPNCLDFLKKLLTKNPDKRPSALEAYQHPWIQQYVSNQMYKFQPRTETLENLSTFKFANKLQAVVYTFIVSQILTSEEKSVLKQLFEHLDHNHDGVISSSEFRQALLEKKELSEEKIKFLVRIIDTNGSGQIDYTEFIVATLQPEALTLEHFEQAFSYFDIDHSGMITYDEIVAFLDDKQNSNEQIRQIFKEVDENSDQMISKEEFLHLLMKRNQQRKNNRDKLKKSKAKLKESACKKENQAT